MVVHVFPIDGELPTLVGATDRRRMAEILGEVLADNQDTGFAVKDCHIDVVNYARQGRCTLRYQVEGRRPDTGRIERRTVYGKVFADNSGALAGQATAALRAHLYGNSAYWFSVPQMLGWRPDLKLALFEAIPGEPLLSDVLKTRLRGEPAVPGAMSLEEMIDVCAHIAAALHTSNIKLGHRHTFDNEIAALRQELEPVQHITPELGAQIEEWIERLQTYAEQSDPLGWCFSHGNFTHSQILFDGPNSGLIDFDTICQAEPALDLGQFIAYLRFAGRKAEPAIPPAPSTPFDLLEERFLTTYSAAMGNRIEDIERLRVRISIYEVVSALRRVLRSWQKMKGDRLTNAIAVLEKEIACLPQLDY
jgi:thiamine kinase-like enzyme